MVASTAELKAVRMVATTVAMMAASMAVRKAETMVVTMVGW